MGGLDASSTDSRSSCSARLSTSARVATTCCASTARHSASSQARDSDATACGVQVLNDMEESLGCQDPSDRLSAQRIIAGVQPIAHGLRLPAGNGGKRAVEAHVRRRELPRLLSCGRSQVPAARREVVAALRPSTLASWAWRTFSCSAARTVAFDRTAAALRGVAAGRVIIYFPWKEYATFHSLASRRAGAAGLADAAAWCHHRLRWRNVEVSSEVSEVWCGPAAG